ncbi:hypothetical protein ACHAXT_010634 [Thalassiosira profunda]
MPKRNREFTRDGWVRVQRTVLRRVVGDRLHALLRGEFASRNKLSDEDYDPIVKEVQALAVPEFPKAGDNNGTKGKSEHAAENGSKAPPQSPPEFPELSSELETFVQLTAASIMIDASLRGEAAESDTRKLKKKKRLLVKTICGPKLGDFRREVLRFDKMRRGEALAPDEEGELEDSEMSDGGSESDTEEEIEVKGKKVQKGASTAAEEEKYAEFTAPLNDHASGGDSSSEEELSTHSAASTANTSLSRSGGEDGFSTSATSTKHSKKLHKKERKKLKKEKRRREKEKKRKEKEKRRREREERRKLKEKRRMEKAAKGEKPSKKRKKHHHHHHHGEADDELSEVANGDADKSIEVEEVEDVEMVESEGEAKVYEIATREDFERYRADLLGRVPGEVRSRFREGGFSKWGANWLPVLELGPFDVEPGPVREMWMDMFDTTQENGRDMTHLVLWYGVKYEDRSQAFSFLPESKIVPFAEGQKKGYADLPKKIQKKLEKNQRLTKTEEQIRSGLSEVVDDMQKDKSERGPAWMTDFKEEFELAAEEEAEKKKKKTKRGPGRPKKVKDEDDEDGEVPKKRGPGRPSNKEKAAAAKKAKKASSAKKWVTVDEDQDSDMESSDDEDDGDFRDDDSDEDDDLEVDGDDDSDVGKKKKRKTSSGKKPKKKDKSNMTEEEKAAEKRAKAAEYREKKAREKAEAQGLEYVKGRVGRKSKAQLCEEEQQKFTKCEEVFNPLMDQLTEAKDAGKPKAVLKCINAIMERVELLTPPFLREYPLGMLVKTVRKSMEGEHAEVKPECKRLTAEMKRVYNEKDLKVPDDFNPVKNRKTTPEADAAALEAARLETVRSRPKSSKKKMPKPKKVAVKREKVPVKSEDPPTEHSMQKTNSGISLASDAMPGKLAATSSSHSLADAVKSEPAQPKKAFSLKGMFEKPKPAPKPKIVAPTPSAVVSGQPSPKPTKALPSWVTGPAMKMEDFHEQHAKERTFGLEFLVEAATQATSSKRFDPVSVSQSFELAIFAETKLRGRNWQQYWEKIHDVVAMLSPGKDKRNSILQGIISGDYQEPSELVKLSRREIESLNQLNR